MFVTQGSEESFPKRLLPSDASGASLELCRLALQAHVRCLVEQVQQLCRRYRAQRGATFAAQLLWQRLRRLATEPQTEFSERGIERLAQHEGRGRPGGPLFAFPDHMEDDVLEGGVAIMAMGTPAAGTKVHFHVAGPRRRIADLHNRTTKIRSALHAAETRMKDTDRFTVQGLELFAEQALMLPDGLQEALGRGVTVLVKD
jgi:hypothetical protein